MLAQSGSIRVKPANLTIVIACQLILSCLIVSKFVECYGKPTNILEKAHQLPKPFLFVYLFICSFIFIIIWKENELLGYFLISFIQFFRVQ